MIKIKIEALGLELDIEIKDNEDFYSLIVIRSKTSRKDDKGDKWHCQIMDRVRVKELEYLIMEASKNPAVRTEGPVTILDAVITTFIYSIDGKVGKFEVIDFVKNSNELLFMEKLFSLMHELIDDSIFKDYYSE
jgi:hypothetical protein